jgi:hypothetical protein
VIIRLSQKLNAKVKAGALAALPLEGNPFADWSAHLFVFERTQHVLLSNTRSLYSTVTYGRGVTDDRRLIERALSSIREFMEDDGQGFAYHRFVAPSGDTIRFAKSLNRSVMGSMNELTKLAKFVLADGERSPFDLGSELNGTLLSSLGSGGSGTYGTPREAFRAMAKGYEP